MQVETSKGEAWPGQHEINFRYSDAVTMADNHVVYKNGAKEIAHLNGCSITFMAKPDHTSIGSSCHIHALALARRRERVRRRVRHVQAVPRGPDRLRARARDLLRADDQLVQALRGRELGADDAGVGPRQPHVRLPHRRQGRGAARGDADPRRRRQPVPRVRGADRRRPPRDRARAASCRRRSRETRTSRTSSASRLAPRGDRRARERHDGARGVSATRSSTTTSTTRVPSRSSSTASSPATSASASSNAARAESEMRPVIGITTYAEQARWGAWDLPAALIPLMLRADGRRRGRAAAARAAVRARRRGDARRARRAASSPAAPTSTPTSTVPSRTPRRRARAPTVTPPSSRCSTAALERDMPVLADLPRQPGAERRARRRPRPAPPRGRRRRAAQGDARASSPTTT